MAALCAPCCLPPEKAQVPNTIFASILSENCSLCTALIFALVRWGLPLLPQSHRPLPIPHCHGRSGSGPPEDPNIQESLGPDEMSPRVPREFTAAVTEPLSMVFQKSRQSGQVPGEEKKGDSTPLRKDRKCDAGNYQHVSLTSVLVTDHGADHPGSDSQAHIPVRHHPVREKLPPNNQPKPPLSHLKTISPCPIAIHPPKQPLPPPAYALPSSLGRLS